MIIYNSSHLFVRGNLVERSCDFTIADIPVPLKGAASSVVNDKIYVIGGYASGWDQPLSSVYEYDPMTNECTNKAEMPTSGSLLRTSVINNMIYAIGGITEYPNPPKENVEVRDSENEPEKTDFHKEDFFFRNVRQLLENHLSDVDFGITELCLSLGMSSSQLYRKFKALTYITVHHFIRKISPAKAQELLHNSDLNVSEVALETGFKNLSHFSRLFSEGFGVTLSQTKSK